MTILSLYSMYAMYTETLVDFHSIPSEELPGKAVAIDFDVVYNQFAKITIRSQRTSRVRSRRVTRTRVYTDTTTRIYHAIKTSDGKVMALAVKRDLEYEVDILWKNTLARSQGGDGAVSRAALYVRYGT